MDSDVNCTPSTVNNHISPTWQSELSEDENDGKSHECLAISNLFLCQFSELSIMKNAEKGWQGTWELPRANEHQFMANTTDKKGGKEPGSNPGPIKRLCREERLVELEEELL